MSVWIYPSDCLAIKSIYILAAKNKWKKCVNGFDLFSANVPVYLQKAAITTNLKKKCVNQFFIHLELLKQTFWRFRENEFTKS